MTLGKPGILGQGGMTSTVRAILRCTWDGLMTLGKPGILEQGGMTSTVRAIPRGVPGMVL